MWVREGQGFLPLLKATNKELVAGLGGDGTFLVARKTLPWGCCRVWT